MYSSDEEYAYAMYCQEQSAQAEEEDKAIEQAVELLYSLNVNPERYRYIYNNIKKSKESP